MDERKRYVNDDRFRVDGDKNMRLLAFAFTIVFVWTGPLFIVVDFIHSCHYTLIYPYITYCNSMWSSTYVSHLKHNLLSTKAACASC